jgi:hypothetical protein
MVLPTRLMSTAIPNAPSYSLPESERGWPSNDRVTA